MDTHSQSGPTSADVVDQAVRQLPTSILTQTIMVCVAGANLWDRLPPTFLIPWLVLTQFIAIARLVLQRHYLRQDECCRSPRTDPLDSLTPTQN